MNGKLLEEKYLKSRLSKEQRGMHLQIHDMKALWKLTTFAASVMAWMIMILPLCASLQLTRKLRCGMNKHIPLFDRGN